MALAGAVAQAQAACHGQDVLASIMTSEPAAYGTFDAAAQAMPFGTGTLFRISRDGTAPSYLLGTLHVADERIADLPQPARERLEASHVAVLETLDLDGKSLVVDGPGGTALAPSLRAAPEERSSKLLGGADLNRLKALTILRGLPAELAELAKPSALALMLDLPICAVGAKGETSFIDRQVLAAAQARHMTTLGLETALEQFTVADGLSPETQAAILRALLAQSSEAKNIIESSVQLYQAGRIGLLLAWTSAPDPFPGRADATMPAAFVDRTIKARTLRMRDRLLPILLKGSAFVAVGALHIPGQDGLGALLERAGYRIERLL